MKRLIETIITENIENQRLDSFLAQRFKYYSRSGWQKFIKEEKIIVNNKPTSKTHLKVSHGDHIIFLGTGNKEPDIDENFSIIFNDENMIAVNKSGDLPVHPAGKYFHNTLSMILENKFNKKIYPVHRLDRETSGIIIFGWSSEASNRLQISLKDAQKTYKAIVHGKPQWNWKTVDLPLGPDKESILRKKRKAYLEAEQTAKTEFRLIESFGNYSLIEAKPKTGRLHQIRAHILSENLPIVGDKIYGKDENYYLDFIENGLTDQLLVKLEMHRCALHAESLKIFDPFSNKEVEFKAPLLKDMIDFINKNRIS